MLLFIESLDENYLCTEHYIHLLFARNLKTTFSQYRDGVDKTVEHLVYNPNALVAISCKTLL